MSVATIERPPLFEAATGLEPHPLPTHLRMLGGAFELLRRDRLALDPASLIRAACRRAGLPDRLPASVGDGLERFCRAARDEAELHWYGRANLRALIVSGLAARLRLDAAFAADPGLADTPLIPPVVICGLPRSGSTFLHRLLATTEDAQPVKLYEHLDPLRPPGMDLRRLRAEVRLWPWRGLGDRSALDDMRRVRPDAADACALSLRLSMRSMSLWSIAPVPGYLEWLLEADMTEAYQTYRRVLQLHQRAEPGRRLTLKCPSHCASLPALTRALPEALIVQTHRAPEQAAPDDARLVLSLQATSVTRLDWRSTVRHNLDRATTYARRSAAFAETEAGRRVHHIDARALLSDPVGAALGIRDHFGLGFNAGHRDRLSRYVRLNRGRDRARVAQSIERFGLEAADLERRFAPYRARFGAWLSPPAVTA